MSEVALSIIIPTYNTAAMTLASCRAALAAASGATEIIVVDDASTDGTRELLAAETPHVRVVRLETNQRFAGAANAGVAVSRGPIVMLLNSDALVEREALAALVAVFDADPRLGIAGARLIGADGARQWSGGPMPTLPWLFVQASGFAALLRKRRHRAKERRVAWVSGAAMAFRRTVWNIAGPLNDRYQFYAQDLEFCDRARQAGWDVRIVEDARVIHDGGATLRQWRPVSDLSHDPALLWSDLLLWSRNRHGPLWAASAHVLICVGAFIRIAARRARELLLRGEERRRSRSTTAVYAAALRELVIKREEPSNQR